uniref:Aspartyl/asparaginyl beta-hydroxylase-like n=1 Tax=Sinocyclocheilus rhinocerous TaxID=307959 RepID=A0A673G1I5_9TELE
MCLRHQSAIRPEEEEDEPSAQVTIRDAELLNREINQSLSSLFKLFPSVIMKQKKTVRNQARKDSPGGNAAIKSEKKTEGNSFFSWLLVLALLGAWLSVGVMWFDLVDYNSVVGALGGVYDADGDGDFDVEDAKVLLDERPKEVGLKKDREHPTRDIGQKLKAALKEQLRIIHEKIEAKKIAKLALAEVRSVLAQEEEERQAALAANKVKEEAEAKLQEERIQREQEEKLAKEKAEKEKMEKEKAEKERLAKEKAEHERLAKEKADKGRAEKEKLKKEKAEKEKMAKEKAEKERLEKEKAGKERLEKEKAEKEKLEKEKAEKEKLEKEKAEKERLAKEKVEKERLAKEKAEKERLEKEKVEKERLAKEKAEKERLAK